MDLFKEHALPHEVILLLSDRGIVRVQKFRWVFQQWSGVMPPRTHGAKPYVEWEDKARFAEIALLFVLRQRGFTDAVWRDNWANNNCFHDGYRQMPECELPNFVSDICTRIRARIGLTDWSGCWDVLAWNNQNRNFMFIECKKAKGSDRINDNQIRWLEAALKEGQTADNFAICEWKFES